MSHLNYFVYFLKLQSQWLPKTLSKTIYCFNKTNELIPDDDRRNQFAIEPMIISRTELNLYKMQIVYKNLSTPNTSK